MEELAAESEETAATTEEVNVSAHEIQNAINFIAQKAQVGAESVKEINERAIELKTNAVESYKQANLVYEATKVKLEGALKQANAVNQINVLSQAIFQISDQTNLLALNAAIEAARAGEAGKGFAVVADEIRKLAEDSQKIISEIQNVTKEVTGSVESLVESSSEVMNFMDSTVIHDYEELKKVGEQYSADAELVNDLMTDFSATSQELTASIEAVITAINEVTKTVNEGAAGNQEIAGKIIVIVEKVENVKKQMQISSENISNLKDDISKFKIE